MPTRPAPAPTGPAHVAVVSFLAARAAPTGGFWIALAGGVALARVAERRGARSGFGASLAAMLETVAIIGPARIGIPLTQALSAPMLGRLEARSVGFSLQLLACATVRLLHNASTTAFFIWIVTGGLDAYAGTYDALGRRLGVDIGTSDALLLTAAGLLLWAAFASTVQVLVYRRGLRRWEAETPGASAGPSEREGEAPGSVAGSGEPRSEPPEDGWRGRFDPRAVAVAATIAFGLLLSTTEWPVLLAVGVWLALAWALSRPDSAPLPTGLAFAVVLAGGAFVFSLGGGLGLDVALRRALRASLLVLTATWLRAAAGADGLREVFRRSLGRMRRLPSIPEASQVLDRIASDGRLGAAARSLTAALAAVRKRPLPILDAVLAWVAREAAVFRAGPPRPPSGALRAHPGDWVLVLLAAVPAAAFAY